MKNNFLLLKMIKITYLNQLNKKYKEEAFLEKLHMNNIYDDKKDIIEKLHNLEIKKVFLFLSFFSYKATPIIADVKLLL